MIAVTLAALLMNAIGACLRWKDMVNKEFSSRLTNLILNPQFLAVVVSLVFWVGGWKLPAAIAYCVKSLQSICSPLALLLCGMVIAEHDVRALAKLKYIRRPLIKTVAAPAVFFLLSRLLLMAGVEPVLCQILVIYAALPVASLLPVYSVKYDPDPANHLDAAGASILSVLLSAVTIPVWYMLIS